MADVRVSKPRPLLALYGGGSRFRDLFSRERCADKFEILDCHQTAINGPKFKQMQANGLSRQRRPSILILLGIVREHFPALEEILITNRLIYH